MEIANARLPALTARVGIQFRWVLLVLSVLAQTMGIVAAAESDARRAPTPDAGVTRLVEVAGTVEYQPVGRTNWPVASPGQALIAGDRVRTGSGSRAAVQFSDRSVLRLGENTTLEILPPAASGRRRFGLPSGLLFFFGRERPSSMEFETPVVSGAIRGTEFVLETATVDGATRLALLDGAVELAAAGVTVGMTGGEQARVDPGRAPVKSPLIEVPAAVQWALHYPAVVYPGDLTWTAEDREVLGPVLALYARGDLIGAHAALAGVPVGGSAREQFRAALDLAVGQVASAEARLSMPVAGPEGGAVRALREVIGLVRDGSVTTTEWSGTGTASEWMARSFTLQARFDLRGARDAARAAVARAPDFGFARVRLATLEMSLERSEAALRELDAALVLAPAHAPAQALRGFILLERGDASGALADFTEAIARDAAFGEGWLGQGLAQMRLGQREAALKSLQTAAALEPRRAVFRSYLGKAFGDAGEGALAEKEFRLARELDPGDPTAWLYSALHQWQENRPNRAVRELERSAELNDHRRLFRSRLRLDRDQAVRSAHLAALYRDAGLPEVSVQSASRAVTEDYSNFSGHLFLAHTYQLLEDPNRFDLRYETARSSELLLANLLAPPGAGNLSQLLSQQEYLRLFDAPRPVGLTTLTQYRSTGDWRQWASSFGQVDGLGYALDAVYESQSGQEIADWREERGLSLQLKQRMGPKDEAYLQVGASGVEAGDVARRYDPSAGARDLRVEEDQAPQLLAGWHRTWTPGNHTLLLFSRLTDSLELNDPDPNLLFVRRGGGISTPPGFESDFTSEYELYSGEIQHLWQGQRNTVIVGGRFQGGDVESEAVLNRTLTGLVDRSRIEEPLRRADVYGYHHWQVVEQLKLIGGLAYEWLEHPVNSELAPLTEGTENRDLISPKAGLVLTPWKAATFRGAYARSLGGFLFDSGVRLEPTQIAGFNQAWRSLLPESSAGIVPGTEFDTVGLALDQRIGTGTYLGIGSEWLDSEGDRTVGTLENSLPIPVPDTPSSTRQTLEFSERNVSAYAVQLLGDGLSLGARYRWSEAELIGRFPGVPTGTTGLEQLQQDESAVLEQVGLTLNYQHVAGPFVRWESDWYQQRSRGHVPGLPVEDFWQHHVRIGYRFPRRRAEVEAGLLNLTDTDYRVTPLNALMRLPRGRTLALSLRLNF